MVLSSMESLAKQRSILLWPGDVEQVSACFFSKANELIKLLVGKRIVAFTASFNVCAAYLTYWIEVSSADWGTGNDGKSDAECKSPSNGEQASKSSVFFVQHEYSCRSYSWKHVEEYPSGFCYTFSEPSRPCMFKVKFPLGHGFCGYHMARIVMLDGLCRP